MKFYLPVEKIKNKTKCQEVLRSDRVSIRKLSEVIGNLTASLQAVHQAPLHYDYHHLKMTQESSLERSELRCKGSLISKTQTKFRLVEEPSEGIQWQKHSNEPRVRCHTTNVTNLGWGPVCQNTKLRGH
jgi:hypothetical protein